MIAKWAKATDAQCEVHVKGAAVSILQYFLPVWLRARNSVERSLPAGLHRVLSICLPVLQDATESEEDTKRCPVAPGCGRLLLPSQ